MQEFIKGIQVITGLVALFFFVLLGGWKLFVILTKPEVEAAPLPDTPIKLVFVGDMMFDRRIREMAIEKGYTYLFDSVRDQLGSADLVIGNLEGVITDNASVSVHTKPGGENNYRFTFAPEVAKVLHDAGIGAVSLANNHSDNFGLAGVEATKQYLHANGIYTFGDPYKRGETLTYTKGEFSIGFVGYNQFAPAPEQDTVHAIEALKKDNIDTIIVYAHWGDEYMPQSKKSDRILARRFIDAGADLVVGTHPHVIQEKEQYLGRTIYYSLGNFVFDQYFDERVTCGLLLTVTLGTKEWTFEETSILIEKGKPLTPNACDYAMHERS